MLNNLNRLRKENVQKNTEGKKGRTINEAGRNQNRAMYSLFFDDGRMGYRIRSSGRDDRRKSWKPLP